MSYLGDKLSLFTTNCRFPIPKKCIFTRKNLEIYTFIFNVTIILLVGYFNLYKLQHISKWNLSLALGLKILIGILFTYLYAAVYGGGDLSNDGGSFLVEAKLLNNVFYASPIDYFKLLTGIGETTELIDKYLYMTDYWSAGDLSVINDSKNIIRFHSLIQFFSGSSAFIHLGITCALSLFGFVQLYKAFQPYVNLKPVIFFWLLLLVPSTLFWTSSLLKEPFLLLGLGLFVNAVLSKAPLKSRITKLLFGALILTGIKPYILAILLLTLLAYLTHFVVFKQKWWKSIVLFISVSISMVVFTPNLIAKATYFLSRKQFDFINVGRGGIHVIAENRQIYYFTTEHIKDLNISDFQKLEDNIGIVFDVAEVDVSLKRPIEGYVYNMGSIEKPIQKKIFPSDSSWKVLYYSPSSASYIEVTHINDSFGQLIKNIPEALVNSIFRPFITDKGSFLKYFAILELLGIFSFLGLAFLRRKKLTQQEKSIIFCLVIFSILLNLLIGWTTPVIGAIVRYRFPAQLAIILICFILTDFNKFRKWKNISS